MTERNTVHYATYAVRIRREFDEMVSFADGLAPAVDNRDAPELTIQNAVAQYKYGPARFYPWIHIKAADVDTAITTFLTQYLPFSPTLGESVELQVRSEDKIKHYTAKASIAWAFTDNPIVSRSLFLPGQEAFIEEYDLSSSQKTVRTRGRIIAVEHTNAGYVTSDGEVKQMSIRTAVFSACEGSTHKRFTLEQHTTEGERNGHRTVDVIEVAKVSNLSRLNRLEISCADPDCDWFGHSEEAIGERGEYCPKCNEETIQ